MLSISQERRMVMVMEVHTDPTGFLLQAFMRLLILIVDAHRAAINTNARPQICDPIFTVHLVRGEK